MHASCFSCLRVKIIKGALSIQGSGVPGEGVGRPSGQGPRGVLRETSEGRARALVGTRSSASEDFLAGKIERPS
jgi:hypothetical protein